MQKPTSLLNYNIIQFVMGDKQIIKLLQARDNHPTTFGIEISCRFLSPNNKNPHLSGYLVSFVYDAKSKTNNSADDISVTVEVSDNSQTPFKIIKVEKH